MDIVFDLATFVFKVIGTISYTNRSDNRHGQVVGKIVQGMSRKQKNFYTSLLSFSQAAHIHVVWVNKECRNLQF